ncbi:NAD(P)-dependent oxidoreductase [Streptomyces sp. NA02950]|uniref:NAD-dependent epimerase/dehydratase family protein n=1 Tax=Streptomyces sp. NA02950 TaxID=2742137 RepID=UPI001592A5F4|nr:NAD(P)-dependent oxidoreductase [Streptomyces sp. NA02950]QKV91016.1 NAD(P)-dependent oxidoreductase [Streptomyces sp. NA02950]
MAISRNRRAVVVGGTGFIGRHICRALARQEYDVLAMARKPAEAIPGVAFLALDAVAAPIGEIAAAMGSADLVVNAAGDSWEGDGERMTASHIPLVDQLVSAVATLPRRPRLLHLGSVHEYGPVPDGTAIAEDHPTAPGTPYARTKLVGSRIVLDSADAGRVDGGVLRVTNVCGPGAPYGSFLGRLAARLRETGEDTPLTLTLVDDRRDFIDVRDVADAVVLAAGAPVTGRAVNIGQGTATGMRELVGLLISASRVPPRLVREEDAPVHSKGGSWTQADIRLARTLLGWSPKVPLKESLYDLWAASARRRPAAAAARTEGH